jgi:hypothetical protein
VIHNTLRVVLLNSFVKPLILSKIVNND